MNQQKEAQKLFVRDFERAFLEARKKGFSIKKIKEVLLNKKYNPETLNRLIVSHYLKQTVLVLFIILLFTLIFAVLFYFIQK